MIRKKEIFNLLLVKKHEIPIKYKNLTMCKISCLLAWENR